MKPIYLEFSGINSFSEKAQIDFRALLSGGLFGIFGDTGSGKSTILDCIHWALYNKMDRADANDCLNYNVDKAYVIFDFEIVTDGKRHLYRVERERRRSGTVKAFLYEFEGGKQLALAEGARDVNNEIEQIIGLKHDDFKMCIALPQGDFAALVNATTVDRAKLISRLFNLDCYGEKLRSAVKSRYMNVEAAVNVLRAEMGQNEGGRDASIEEKQKEIGEKQAQLSSVIQQEKQAETEYKKTLELDEEKKQYDKICATLANLETRVEEMTEKRAKIERLPFAKAVLEKESQLRENERARLEALKKSEIANENAERTKLELEKAKKALEEGNFEEKIVTISVDLEKVRGAQTDILEAQKAEERLNACIQSYNETRKKCVQEDFAGQRAQLEEELSALGQDDTLLEYIQHHYKGVLQAETYAEVRGDLQTIANKYPQTQADIDVLMQKYAESAAADEGIDFQQAQIAFKQAEQKKKAIKKQLEDLDARKREFDYNENLLKLLTEQGKEYRAAYEAAKEKIAFVQYLGTANALETRLKAVKTEQAQAQEKMENARKKEQDYRTETEKQKGLYEAHEKMQATLSEGLQATLSQYGFASVEEARKLLVELGDEAAVKEACKLFFEKYELMKSKRAEIDEKKFVDYDEQALGIAQARLEIVRGEKDGLTRTIASLETELKQLIAFREKYLALEKELVVKEKEKKLCDELLTLVSGGKLLEFVASEYLQEVCVMASKQLLKLTGGRYFLRYDKEFKVGDNLDAGNLRAVKTLSGGEKFLVSLSLALALSSAICQKSLRPIEFFFLDEGFGTLDKKLVDTVMDVLQKLSKEFSIGLISHVEELKNRIDNKIMVTGANEEHGSQVRLVHY